jgi:hypothetical protein
MVMKNGKHRLVGFVELGQLHNTMPNLEGLSTKRAIQVFLRVI